MTENCRFTVYFTYSIASGVRRGMISALQSACHRGRFSLTFTNCCHREPSPVTRELLSSRTVPSDTTGRASGPCSAGIWNRTSAGMSPPDAIWSCSRICCPGNPQKSPACRERGRRVFVSQSSKLVFSAPNKRCHCEERSDVAIPRLFRELQKTDKRPNESPGIVGGLPRPVCATLSQ